MAKRAQGTSLNVSRSPRALSILASARKTTLTLPVSAARALYKQCCTCTLNDSGHTKHAHLSVRLVECACEWRHADAHL